MLIRNWVVAGSPMPAEVTQDSYGRWIGVLRGILHVARIPGNVDDESTRSDAHDPEAEEFAGFLAQVYERFGQHPWTTKELLAQVCHPAMAADGNRPIPFDALPEWLVQKHKGGDPITLARTLGKGLQFRQGRYFGDLSVVRAGQDQRSKTAYWRLKPS